MMSLKNFLQNLQALPFAMPVVLDFGGARYGIKRVSGITTGYDIVVIEAGDFGMTVAGLLATLRGFYPQEGYSLNSSVQLFAANDDDYGYYDVGSFLVVGNAVWITAGNLLQRSA
jgi:hypothetical protein